MSRGISLFIADAVVSITEKLFKHKCRSCGCEWRSSVEKPKVCQKCKSPYWNKKYIWKSKQGKEKV